MADIEATDPHVVAERGLRLSGMDYIQAIFAGELPPPPIAELMGFRGVSAEPGRAVFEMEPGPQHYNPIGSVHGGVALTLLDSAMGCAVHTLLEPGVGYTTLEVKTNFVRPIKADTGLIRCEGTVIHEGSRVVTAEGKLTDAAGKLLAHGTTTCLLFPSGG
jgi:uncharacterized protein (TIGR00369 family)